VAEIRDELTFEVPRAVRRLQFELQDALKEESARRGADETKSQAAKAVASLRFPKPVLTPEYEQRVVAIDSRTYNGPKEALESATHQRRWDTLFTTVEAVHRYWVRKGEVLWNELGLEGQVEKTRELLTLDVIDEKTARAVHIAVFTAFNSCGVPVDIDSILLALSAFIHTHPDLKGQAKECSVTKSFGSSTAYIAARVSSAPW
jgi:hypothetical protein